MAATDTSCNIEFTGQDACRFSCMPLKTSRVQPTALASHMSTVEWNSFCDRVDEQLAPLAKWRVCMSSGYLIMVAIFISVVLPLVLLPSLSPRDGQDALEKSEADQNGTLSDIRAVLPFRNYIIYAMMFLFLVSMFAIPICAKSYGTKKASTIEKELQAICQEMSSRNSLLSFSVYLRFVEKGSISRKNYSVAWDVGMQVSIPDTEAGAIPVEERITIGDEQSSSTPNFPSSGEQTPADRLVELDDMRDTLAPEEYDRRRNEILDSWLEK